MPHERSGKDTIPTTHAGARLGAVAEQSATSLSSGDALFAFETDMTIVSWNRAAEELTGIPAKKALGRRCWEVLGGQDENGNVVCHRGCSTARLAREGWPVSCQGLLVNARAGKRPVEISTVVLEEGDHPLYLHILRPRESLSPQVADLLTGRQLEVLQLLAEGFPAKVIAARLEVAESTARNHIRAILFALGTHSQLEAVAKARRLRLVE